MCETRRYAEPEFTEQSACLQFLEDYWGKERCISKYLEHKRMENNNNCDALVAPQIGWGEESIGFASRERFKRQQCGGSRHIPWWIFYMGTRGRL